MPRPVMFWDQPWSPGEPNRAMPSWMLTVWNLQNRSCITVQGSPQCRLWLWKLFKFQNSAAAVFVEFPKLGPNLDSRIIASSLRSHSLWTRDAVKAGLSPTWLRGVAGALHRGILVCIMWNSTAIFLVSFACGSPELLKFAPVRHASWMCWFRSSDFEGLWPFSTFWTFSVITEIWF